MSGTFKIVHVNPFMENELNKGMEDGFMPVEGGMTATYVVMWKPGEDEEESWG